MAEGFIEIIFFAMVAVFIILRLRSVLGRRTGHQRPQDSRFSRAANSDDANSKDNIITLPDRSEDDDETEEEAKFSEATASPNAGAAEYRASERRGDAADANDPVANDPLPHGPLAKGIAQIQMGDRSFEPNSFISGSRTAYDIILTSFASGDTDTLRALLGDDVYDGFQRAIRARDTRKETLETTVVAAESTEIVEAGASGRNAEVTVKFSSEIVNVTRDAEGEVVSGDARDVQHVTDYWTFVRDLKSRDPNWKLVATRSEN